jgi:hypothetical protein
VTASGVMQQRPFDRAGSRLPLLFFRRDHLPSRGSLLRNATETETLGVLRSPVAAGRHAGIRRKVHRDHHARCRQPAIKPFDAAGLERVRNSGVALLVGPGRAGALRLRSGELGKHVADYPTDGRQGPIISGSPQTPPIQLLFPAVGASSRTRAQNREFAGNLQWSQPGSNRRPPACKAGALPTELWPRWVESNGAEAVICPPTLRRGVEPLQSGRQAPGARSMPWAPRSKTPPLQPGRRLGVPLAAGRSLQMLRAFQP